MSQLITYIDSLRAQLADSPLTNREISDLTSGAVSPRWVSAFRNGGMRNPQAESLLALERALAGRERQAA